MGVYHSDRLHLSSSSVLSAFAIFFFNDTATTEIYTLSLHDALPICSCGATSGSSGRRRAASTTSGSGATRSEEHTSELQSHLNLVCRLLLEKKKYKTTISEVHDCTSISYNTLPTQTRSYHHMLTTAT